MLESLCSRLYAGIDVVILDDPKKFVNRTMLDSASRRSNAIHRIAHYVREAQALTYSGTAGATMAQVARLLTAQSGQLVLLMADWANCCILDAAWWLKGFRNVRMTTVKILSG